MKNYRLYHNSFKGWKIYRFTVDNRYKKKVWSRNYGNRVFFGISEFHFNYDEKEIRLHLFGVDLRFWFQRKNKER